MYSRLLTSSYSPVNPLFKIHIQIQKITLDQFTAPAIKILCRQKHGLYILRTAFADQKRTAGQSFLRNDHTGLAAHIYHTHQPFSGHALSFSSLFVKMSVNRIPYTVHIHRSFIGYKDGPFFYMFCHISDQRFSRAKYIQSPLRPDLPDGRCRFRKCQCGPDGFLQYLQIPCYKACGWGKCDLICGYPGELLHIVCFDQR